MPAASTPTPPSSPSRARPPAWWPTAPRSDSARDGPPRRSWTSWALACGRACASWRRDLGGHGAAGGGARHHMIDLDENVILDLTVDGADEVAPNLDR